MSKRLKYNIIYEEGGKTPISATVFRRGRFYIATQDHPNFDQIVEALESKADHKQVIDLYDTGSVIAKGFRLAGRVIKAVLEAGESAAELEKISKEVEVRNGELFFKGEPMHGALADTIIAMNREKREEAFVPLVKFLAKVMANPNPHSREHLYEWMRHLSFNVNDDGDVIAYKGVRRHTEHGFVSTTAGPAIIDGKAHVGGHVPNAVGSLVEMKRDAVTFDPTRGCAAGLHVGTLSYARSYGDAMIEVQIDPRDVVSVPTEDASQKMRVCKYKVLREVTGKDVRLLQSKAQVRV
jgi:hypothetical protein